MRTLFVLTMVVVMTAGCGEKAPEARSPLPMNVEKLLADNGRQDQLQFGITNCPLNMAIKQLYYTETAAFANDLKKSDEVFISIGEKEKQYVVCRRFSKLVFSDYYVGCLGQYRHAKLSADRSTMICTDDTVPLEPNELQLR